MSDEKCCGTCKWWELNTLEAYQMGECRFPLPSSLDNLMRADMFRWNGTRCPCHAPKEQADER